jgi:hypothetical protein
MVTSDKFFCSAQSLLLNEELIGTALLTEVYILIECKKPWANEAFESKRIPHKLRLMVKQYRESARFLLIQNNNTKHIDHIQVLFYIRSNNYNFSTGFTLYRAECSDYDRVCDTLEDYFINQKLPSKDSSEKNRNILICTHGGFDQCCGKYGTSFYIKSNDILESNNVHEKVEVWESSHFGGHRFAPTMIDFPDGRYYGRMNEDIFTAIINRTGDLNKTVSSYRGWAILPKVAQVVEKQLLLDIGWQWFNASAASQIKPSEDGVSYDVTIIYLLGHDEERVYSARVSKKYSQSLSMRIRCQNPVETVVPQFSVDSLD